MDTLLRLLGMEDVLGIAAEKLRRAFQEECLWAPADAGQRESCVVDAILAADQVLRDQAAGPPTAARGCAAYSPCRKPPASCRRAFESRRAERGR